MLYDFETSRYHLKIIFSFFLVYPYVTISFLLIKNILAKTCDFVYHSESLCKFVPHFFG